MITTTSDRDGFDDKLLKSQILYDGLGRTVESRTYESTSAYIRTNTNYDGLGRVSQVSNPYRMGDTVCWTTTTYDALGRAVNITSPDGATVNTAYDGARVRVTDQDSKQRISETDALGRLIKVWEVKPMDGDTVSLKWPQSVMTPNVYGYLTDYTYDTLDNLTYVTQVKSSAPAATQMRTFTYDELRRLKTAYNPESGMVSYQYDNNSNLTQRTDARSITTTFNYDVLNRPTTKTYSNGTPTVKYCYDNNAQFVTGAPVGFDVGSAIGHLTAVNYGTSSSAGDYYGYDQLGRAVRKTQRIDTNNYPITATYNRASAMTGETYPSGNTVSYGFDQVGRLTSFNGNLGTGGAALTYASITQFNAASQVERATFGTTDDLYLKLAYNKRLQMVDLRLADRASTQTNVDWNRGKLQFFYGPNAVTADNPFSDDPTNNGNVRRSVHAVPGTVDASGGVMTYAVPQRQDYTYDELNRILTATETQMPSGGAYQASVSQTFSYDRFGNRKISGVTGSGVNGLSLAFNPVNNRIDTVAHPNYAYDLAGNLTNESGNARTYDAENRIVSATGGSYVYDGDGKRVKRTAGSSTYCYVYGLGGELLAEYMSTAPAANAPTKQYGYQGGKLLVVAEGTALKWLVSDHLGSTRMEVGQVGSLASVTRHDYMPFGEESFAGIRRSGNTGMYGYESQPPASTTRQRFTGYERDVETGLDFAQARHYASGQGRFTSPDEFQGGPREPFILGSGSSTKQALPYAEIANPQSLNKYQYAYNNPLRFIDPDGHMPDGDGDVLTKFINSVTEFINALAAPLVRAANGGNPNPEVDTAHPLGGKEKIVSDYAQAVGKGTDLTTKAALTLDITGAGTTIHGYLTGNKTEMGMGMAGMAIGAWSGAGRLGTVGWSEAKALVSKWSTDTTFGKGLVKLVEHAFEGHGADVGARNIGEYLRKAAGFNKKGATREVFADGTRIRYRRDNGTYLITDAQGNFVSYGRNTN